MKNNSDPNTIIEFVETLKKENIPESEYRQRISSFIEFKARKNHIPLNGNFELTPLCNLDCKMCYVHLNNSQFDSQNLLSVDQWKDIIHQAYEHGMRSACLTGGECLTYPGFREVYLYLMSLKVKTSVLSNGILMTSSFLDFFIQNRPKMIQISVYGSDDDEYEAVTGHRVFNQVYNHISMIRDAGLPIRVAITPNQYMRKDFRPLLEKVSSLGVPYTINSSLFEARDNTGRNVENLSLDDYLNLYRVDCELCNRHITPIDAAELPEPRGSGEAEVGLRCGGGRSSFSIKHDGYMCTCFSLSDFSVNTLDFGFEKAWKTINKYSDSYPFPKECNGCAYYEDCYHCMALHKQVPLGHCNPAVCERIMAMVRSGLKTLHK